MDSKVSCSKPRARHAHALEGTLCGELIQLCSIPALPRVRDPRTKGEQWITAQRPKKIGDPGSDICRLQLNGGASLAVAACTSPTRHVRMAP